MKTFYTLLLLSVATMCFAKTLNYEAYRDITHYDTYFKEYSNKFFGNEFDWKLFKSQAIAESNFNVFAKSPAGAEGLMQVMPNTFKEITKKCPEIKGTSFEAKTSIAAGIYYNRELYELWKTKKGEERILFMLASYNAGKGNIIKAQKEAISIGEDPHKWDSIKQTLHKVTGNRSKETINYVRRVKQIRREI